MSRVFLSYAVKDSAKVDSLQRELGQRGIEVWRDKEGIRTGDLWPKVVGKAIEDADAVVLIWSDAAAASKYVDMEWNTAVALKKPLLPWLLDKTPLPAALRPVHGVAVPDPAAAAGRIQQALQSVPRQPTGEKLPLTEWLKKRWQWSLAFLLAVCAVTSFLFLDPPPAQILAGFVRGEQNEPLPEVAIDLPAFHQSGRTDQTGYFHFVVPAADQEPVVLLARKQGYETHESYATLGNESMTFTLRRAR